MYAFDSRLARCLLILGLFVDMVVIADAFGFVQTFKLLRNGAENCWLWVTQPAASRSRDCDEALLAIATIAVVMWTALFLVRAVPAFAKKLDSVAQQIVLSTSAILASAFVGTTIALFADSRELRMTILFFAVVYSIGYALSIWNARLSDARLRAFGDLRINVARAARAAPGVYATEIVAFFAGLGYCVVWTEPKSVAIVGTFWLLLAPKLSIDSSFRNFGRRQKIIYLRRSEWPKAGHWQTLGLNS